MSVPFKVVVPARYASTRLPGKPLLDIAGKPMILHVCDRALQANAEQVIVATDDDRIFKAVRSADVEAVMTRPDHHSGTERIAEVAKKYSWRDSDIIVNLQGDEPLLPPAYIQDVAAALALQQQAGIATLAAPIEDPEEVFNANAVKVVVDGNGYALYFSRAPIPWDRDHFDSNQQTLADTSQYLRHIGLYAYRTGFLQRYVTWPASMLEKIEALEQLRILWQGEAILVKTVPTAPLAGVDTPADLQRVINILKQGV